MTYLTEDELKESIKSRLEIQLDNDDTEDAHQVADDLLCEFLTELGYQDIVEIYMQIRKWYA